MFLIVLETRFKILILTLSLVSVSCKTATKNVSKPRSIVSIRESIHLSQKRFLVFKAFSNWMLYSIDNKDASLAKTIKTKALNNFVLNSGLNLDLYVARESVKLEKLITLIESNEGEKEILDLLKLDTKGYYEIVKTIIIGWQHLNFKERRERLENWQPTNILAKALISQINLAKHDQKIKDKFHDFWAPFFSELIQSYYANFMDIEKLPIHILLENLIADDAAPNFENINLNRQFQAYSQWIETRFIAKLSTPKEKQKWLQDLKDLHAVLNKVPIKDRTPRHPASFFDKDGICRANIDFLHNNNLIPYVEAQNDDWSCGLNVATRYLKIYNIPDITYPGLKQWLKDKSIFTTYKFGTSTSKLVTLLGEYVPRVTSSSDTSIQKLKRILCKKKPVAVLIKSDVKTLHWILMIGFIEDSFMFIETSGKLSHIDRKDFQHVWDWSINGLLAPAYYMVGMRPNTIVYQE